MQFEDFDKKIKEAAENHHPAYDEQAWAKMNKLLDKHMPEKEERRRRFAWLFFLLFLVGGAGIFYGVQSLVTTNTAGPVVTTQGNRSELSRDHYNERGIKEEGKKMGTTEVSGLEISPAPPVPEAGQSEMKQPVAGQVMPLDRKEKGNERINPRFPASDAVGKKAGTSPSIRPSDTDGIATPVFLSGLAKKKNKKSVTPVAVSTKKVTDDYRDIPAILKDANPISGNTIPLPDMVQATPDQNKVSTDPVAVLPQAPADTAITRAELPVVTSALEKKKSPGKQSRFFLTLSAGPDASFTSNGNLGRIVPVTGAGIAYVYRERLSIRAGFYNAAKVYTASPEAYKAPANFYTYYPFLVKVDADCRVYEIPVSLGYHFGARKNHSWFASATLSSYLMKRETYNYSYKTSAWGTVQQREWTLNNQNQHLFSVLGLSAGYQRKITDRISFIAEPYLRVPFQGVGYGKVKLNSAGMLFSLAIQPAALIPHKQKK